MSGEVRRQRGWRRGRAHLLGVRLAEAAAKHREVLRKDEDEPPVNVAVACHHPVASWRALLHPKVCAAVRLEHVVLAEGTLVEKQVEPLARRQLALAVLRLNARGAATKQRSVLVRCEPRTHIRCFCEDARRLREHAA